MANLQTSTDLVTYILEGMREKADSTSSWYAKALVQLNRSYRAMIAGGQALEPSTGKPVIFPWAKAKNPKIINTEVPITTTTVSVTNGIPTATLSVANATSLADWHIRVGSDQEVYRITAHTGGDTLITLDGKYVKTTSATATCVIFKVKYDFGADVLIPIAPIMAYSSRGPRELNVISKNAFNRDWPMSEIRSDSPTRAALVATSGEGTTTIQLNAYPSEMERFEMEYIAEPVVLDLAGSDPICPPHQRVVIADYALAHMLTETDDDRAQYFLQMAQRGFLSMIAESKGLHMAASRNFGRIIPRLDLEHDGDRYVTTDDGFIIDLGT